MFFNVDCVLSLINGKSPEKNPVEESLKEANIYYPFILPIKYLEKKQLHTLSPIVVNDLELAREIPLVIKNEEGITEEIEKPKLSPIMYDYLFQPTTDFATNMIQDWKGQYTTNIDFLNDSQVVLKNMERISQDYDHCSKDDCENMLTIWKEVKQDDSFLEKYSFVEWEAMKYLNESPEFLQTLSLLNMTSPAFSFMIPLLFMVFPFIILKIQGVPITFSVYISTLQELAQRHVLGRALINMQSVSFENLSYLIITVILYCMQMYQNTVLCMKFYKNINKINNYLCDTRTYILKTTASMRKFDAINFGVDPKIVPLKTYEKFHKQNQHYRLQLEEFHKELECIRPFSPSLFKITEIGYLLKCFYRLHYNKIYENAMLYSFGFNGYLDNMFGVYKNIENNKLNLSCFDTQTKTKIVNEYYPPLLDSNPVKNTCDLSKNMIITGPNGSGKTTMLKTTMINIIFTQQIGAGFYQNCTLNPYTHIFSYLNIPDTSSYDSLFQAEARRCKVILDDIQNYTEKNGFRHFYIFDEIFSGTSPTQAEKLIYHYLSYLCKRDNVDFCLTSHHIKACKQLKKNEKIQNYKMIVEELEDHHIKYTYKMKKGISMVEGSISVIKQMNYPQELIEDICS